jgi:DNA-binding NtrC family response regulator
MASNYQPQRTVDLGGNFEDLHVVKVLLLEDDIHFADILKTYLESLFYEVTAVKSGVEGLKAVMAADFDVIVCDMLMPHLPGDMFYLAVEKTKPYLCKKFIFITGHKGLPKIDNFIKSINGTILPKPFHMDTLREMIAYTISRR